MSRKGKQLLMVALFVAALLCYAFGDAFGIGALLWVALALVLGGFVLSRMLCWCPACKLRTRTPFAQYCPYCGEKLK